MKQPCQDDEPSSVRDISQGFVCVRARSRACMRVCMCLELHQREAQAALVNSLVPCLPFHFTQPSPCSQSGVRRPLAEPPVAAPSASTNSLH